MTVEMFVRFFHPPRLTAAMDVTMNILFYNIVIMRRVMEQGPHGGRIQFIDTFKGFAIVAIVFVHMFVLEPGGSPAGVPQMPVIEFFYTGLIMFLIVSGMFYKKERSYSQNVKKRSIQLLLALVSAAVALTSLMFLILTGMGYDISLQTLLDTIYYTIAQDAFLPIDTEYVSVVKISAGFYFIEVLFGAYLIFYAIADWCIASLRNYVISVLAMVTASAALVEYVEIILPLYFQILPMTVAFLITGAYIKKVGLLDMVINEWGSRKFWIITAIAFVVGTVLCVFTPTGLNFAWMKFGSFGGLSAYPFFVLNVCCGWVLLTVPCYLISKIGAIRGALSFVGRFTFPILLMHIFFAKTITSLFYEIPATSIFPVRPVWFSITTAVISICLSILAAIILAKIIDVLKERYFSTSSEE